MKKERIIFIVLLLIPLTMLASEVNIFSPGVGGLVGGGGDDGAVVRP